MKQNDAKEQEHQEYHNHEWSDSISEEMEDISEINPLKDGSVLAAHQAQTNWEELYPFTFYCASSWGWFWKTCQQYSEGVHWVSEAVNFGEHPRRY